MSRPLDRFASAPLRAYEEDRELRTRVRAEFREMPGMKITLAQAVRLFSIESSRCERVLGALVEMGELSTDGTAFSSPWEGRRSA